MRRKKGFTLVELMIVMVIIGILLSLLLPAVFTAQKEALKTQTASNMRQIGIALYAHAKNNNGVLPDTLLELETEKYVEDIASINSNVDANVFTFNPLAAGKNLYNMTPSFVLLTDNAVGDNPTGYILQADGSINTTPAP